MKIGCYARVSTQDQQTLALQRDAMAAYAQQRGWSIVATITEVGSGVRERQQRDQLMRAARRREIDAIVVWRLDRWGRSVVDLVSTLHELQNTFSELGAAQCGYCTPGMLLTAMALLRTTPLPDRQQIKEALAGNLCRCTGYVKILEAVELAAQRCC